MLEKSTNSMIFKSILLFPLLASSFGFTPPEDFCETVERICVFEDHTLKHIFCEPDDEDDEGDGRTIIEINDPLKESILTSHNRYRNALACGNVQLLNIINEVFPKAIQMPVLSWDDELQWSAEELSAFCIPQHDQCRITPSFEEVGQNIGTISPKKPLEDPTSVVNDIIRDWFQEYVNLIIENVDKIRFSRAVFTYKEKVVKEMIDKNFNPKTYQTKNFIQMVLQNATKVGCGLSLCSAEKGKYTYILVCNYNSQSNVNGWIYQKGNGDPGGSKCTEKSQNFCCLCKEGEEAENKGCDKFANEYRTPVFPKNNVMMLGSSMWLVVGYVIVAIKVFEIS